MKSLFPTLPLLTKLLINKPLSWVGIALSIWLLPAAGILRPALGAERIYLTYGALERSLSITSLAKYAKTGKIDGELADYAHRLNRQQLAQLRSVLLAPINLSPVAVSQFLYTPIGERLLERLGEVIQTKASQPGFYAIRASLILAAADPQGLTLLNILQKFPTSGIRIDLARSLEISRDLEKLVNQTNRAVALVSQQSAAEIATAQPEKLNFSQLPDLRRRGHFTWNKQTLRLNDGSRARVFPADIYLPNVKAPAPLIVISHGLGSDRTSFAYLAQHLASYGFAVAVPEHPDSNAQQLRSLLAGRANEVAEPSEFVNRPLDVKFLLNELQRRSQSDPIFSKVNVQQVGVIGQSFGGYVALALAGAPLNLKQLQKDCNALNNSLNASLLLQCRALQLLPIRYSLHDARVKAAIAINPIDSSVFGQTSLSQIQIPVMLVSGSADTIAPALSEQILPFTWLTTPQKYFVMIQGGTHFSTIGETTPDTTPLAIPPQVIGPDPALARLYMNALSVAFCQTYVAGAPQYRPYLSASYAKAISQALLSLNLVQSLTAPDLAQVLGDSNLNRKPL